MDGLSAAASILSIIQATAELVIYLKNVKDAPEECRRCQAEAASLHNLLNNLLYHLNQANNETWCQSVRALTVENGPLDQYKQVLSQLLSKVETQNCLGKLKKRLKWTVTKEDVTGILARMERMKSLIGIALDMDSL